MSQNQTKKIKTKIWSQHFLTPKFLEVPIASLLIIVKLLSLIPKSLPTSDPQAFPLILSLNVTRISPISYIPHILWYFSHLYVFFTLLRTALLTFSRVGPPTYLSSFNSMSFNFYGFSLSLEGRINHSLICEPKEVYEHICLSTYHIMVCLKCLWIFLSH